MRGDLDEGCYGCLLLALMMALALFVWGVC